MKLFRREIFILESGESGLIDGIFDRVVKVRRRYRYKSGREEPLRQENLHTEVIFQRQSNCFSCLVSRNFAAQTDVLRGLPSSDKLKVDVCHPRLGKLFLQCGHLVLILAPQYDFYTADGGRRCDFGGDCVSRHHTGTQSSEYYMTISQEHPVILLQS
jgi:hypothetical protein